MHESDQCHFMTEPIRGRCDMMMAGTHLIGDMACHVHLIHKHVSSDCLYIRYKLVTNYTAHFYKHNSEKKARVAV